MVCKLEFSVEPYTALNERQNCKMKNESHKLDSIMKREMDRNEGGRGDGDDDTKICLIQYEPL